MGVYSEENDGMPFMSQTTTEVCVGCTHSIALHFNDVTGVARCLWSRISNFLGLVNQSGCDCANFVLPKHPLAP